MVEYDYAVEQFGCRAPPSLILCTKIRMFVSSRDMYPRLDELIVYQYEPCEDSCEHRVPIEEMINIQTHSVLEYGTLLLTCDQLHDIYSYSMRHGRYPLLGESVEDMHQIDEEEESDYDTELMHNHVDRIWDQRQSGVSVDTLPSFDLEATLPDQCIFCQDALQVHQHVLRLPCAHVFHYTRECQGIKQWFDKINACPLCRNGI